jgi:surfactin family lipopeptide synthetase C
MLHPDNFRLLCRERQNLKLLVQERISVITSPQSIEESYALSPMQQGMIFHSLYAGHSGVEIEQMIYTLHEELQVCDFMRAWQQVVDRHAILRTSFQWEGLPEPLQQVRHTATLEWRIEDWREFSREEQRQRLEDYLQEDRARGFQLTEASLNRLALFQIGEGDYEFVWTFHHAIIDGRSFVTVLKEAFDFYEAFKRGDELHLPLPRPYSHYINWLQEQDWAKAERFWRALLKGFTSPTPLPCSRSAHSNKYQDYAEQETHLCAELTSTLKGLGKDNGVTLNNIVQGAWALLLSRYSNATEVVFGTTRACRRTALEGAELMVGPFINTLPLRIEAPGDMKLLEWFAQIRRQQNAQREYEHTPLMKIQEWSEVPRGKSLFDSILVFENYELDSYLRSLGGNWANREFTLLEQTNYKLALSGWAGPELLLKFAYDRRNFDDGTIRRMLGHLRTLLENFATNPQQKLSECSLLTQNEEQQLLFDWNDTQTEFSERLCVHQLFERQAERTPAALALMLEDESLTYQELNWRANQLARYLQRLGVEPEQLVCIALERSLEMVVGLLGILKAGAAYVPLDPAYPNERLSAMLEDARPKVLLTQERLLEKLPRSEACVVRIDSDWPRIAQESRENPDLETTAQNLAYVIYTSGSTGKPKGVMIEHRSLVNYTESASLAYAIEPMDRLLQFASISFDASAEEIYPTLACGATLVLRNEAMLASISTFLETCDDWKITILDLPTAYWHELVAQLASKKLALPASLRLLIIGGERVLPDRLGLWQRVAGNRLRLVNTYGPTEATIAATSCDLACEVETESANQSESSLRDAPIGRAIANTQIYILDPHLRPAPVGVAGELHIGGAGLARGYLHHPELTARNFIPDPFSKRLGARLYKSGDLARYLPDGQIEFCGRADDQVKIHGFRIELGEIESTINLHPLIQEAVVLAREDAPGEKRLVAYLVPDSQSHAHQPTLVEELRLFLKKRLPAYMVPTAFVTLYALPINANGKVDRKQLPAPGKEHYQAGMDYVKPRNPLQYQLAQIWEELFEIRPIGIRDNFFELGGHSLLSVRLMDRIEQVLGKKLPLATLFAGATIEHLSEALLKQEAKTLSAPLVAVQAKGAKPPFFYLHGDFQGGGLYCLNLARHLESDQPFYAIQPHGLEGRQIPKTIEEMAADHLETLRTFQPVGPYQLGGHCNGGLLAFEMARQLEAAGQEVKLLVLICASGVNARYHRLQDAVNQYCNLQEVDVDERQRLFLRARGFAVRVREIRQYYAGRLKELAQLTLREQLAFVGSTGSKGLQAVASAFPQARQNGKAQTENGKAHPAIQILEDPNLQANEAYVKAMMSYVPRSYSGQVTIFWPDEWARENPDGATAGWRDLAPDLDVHIVPGGHLTCLIQHTEELARHLQMCLNAAQTKK